MKQNTRALLFPEIIYDDAYAALGWLARAFGFVQGEVIGGPNGSIAHSEMHYGDVTIMPKSPMVELGMKSPRTLGGISQCLYLTVDDPDAHCSRARAAGAEILMEPKDMEYGARNYIARDLEGHIWCFGTYRPKRRSGGQNDKRAARDGSVHGETG